MTLEPIGPKHAVELYLNEKRNDLATTTIASHRSRLGHLVQWCDQEGIDNLNDLTGRKLHEYRIWRRNDGDLSKASEKTQMDTIRVFIQWLESIEGVPQDLHTKVLSPSLSAEENTRNEMLDSEQAERVLEFLGKYHYASVEHTSIALLWHIMARRGAVRALDVDDYDRDGQHLDIIHRPESGTPLKNKERGERMVALSEKMCELLNDWIADQRPDVTDEYGREPLLASRQGRLHVTTLQIYVYMYTRPCVYTNSCPHERNIETCEATERDAASKCPTSVSPHAIRRGSITCSLNDDVPEKVIGDRANVSQDVLDQHYDRRSKEEKMEQRRGFLM